MSTHYIKLRENIHIENYEQQDKITALELETPEERFPFDDLERSQIEIYFKSSYQDCISKMNSIDEDIRDFFEIQSF